MITLLIIYIIIGIILVIVALLKEPILLAAGWGLLFLVLFGIALWPILLVKIAFDNSPPGGRWI